MSFISNKYHHEQTTFEKIFVKWHNFGRRIMVHTCDKGTPFASVSTEWCMVLNLFFSIHAITKDEYTFVGWVNALDAIWQQKNSTKFSWLKNCKRIFGSQGISTPCRNFTDFPTGMWTVGNLWISEASLSQQEKFQRSSDLPNIKYNCVLLFLNQLYWVFIYDSKYIFS